MCRQTLLTSPLQFHLYEGRIKTPERDECGLQEFNYLSEKSTFASFFTFHTTGNRQ
jgi:hypothetical protein